MNRKTVEDAEHMLKLIRAATGHLVDNQVNVQEERLYIKVSRIASIMGIAQRIWEQAQQELQIWEDMDDLLSNPDENK